MSGFLGIMFPGGGAGGLPPVTPSTYLAYGGGTAAKRVTVYNWDSATGFGSIFANSSIANTLNQVSFVRDNSVFSASFTAAPYFNVWQWSGLGFGTQYANPGTSLSPSSGGPAGFTWTNNVDAFLTSNVNSSFPQAWAWSQASGFGSKYSNGSSLVSAATSTGLALNGDNTLVAFSQNTAPPIHLYPWSSATGFGTKYASPTSATGLIPRAGSIAFNAVTNDVVVGGIGTDKVSAYAVSSAGFGAKYSNPAQPILGAVFSVRFHPDGSAILFGNNDTPKSLKIYQWGAGFGSLYTGPSIAQTVNSSDWSSTGTEIAASQTFTSPYTSVFSWTSGGVGSAYSNPATAPGVPNCVSFSNQTR